MISYKVVFTRRRTILITINPRDGVTVRAPYRTSAKSIDNFVRSKSAWIHRHLDGFSSLIHLGNPVKTGEKILFRGREYLTVTKVSGKDSVEFSGDEMVINTVDNPDQQKLDLLVNSYFRKIAEEVFGMKMEDMLLKNEKHGFRPTCLSVKPMKSRWGSCSNRGKITVNSELIRLDDKFHEYIILHELCHLKHCNHGREFYSLLSEVSPEWKNIRRQLGKYHS